MKNKNFGIGILCTALLLLSTTFMPVVNGKDEANSNNGAILEKNLVYTTAGLKDLYQKNGITENDLKFAKDELPNYLEGTILKSNLRVIATENGKPPEGYVKGKNYDKIISLKEMNAIIDGAKGKYIKKYGVDPANPKITIANGYYLPNEEVKNLVKSGKIILQDDTSVNEVPNALKTSLSWNPYAINNRLTVYVFPAKDSRHAPTEDITQGMADGLRPFVGGPAYLGLSSVNWQYYWNYWDASNIQTASSSSQALDDLINDAGSKRTAANIMIVGWAHFMDHNGISYPTSPYSVCSDTSTSYVNWPHGSIVQHELSHNFDVPEVDSPTHPTCVMKYSSAYLGCNTWCTSCKNTVKYGLFH